MNDKKKAAYSFLALLGIVSLFSDLTHGVARSIVGPAIIIALVVFSVIAQAAWLPFFFRTKALLSRKPEPSEGRGNAG
jgi:hypothetical protein